MKQTNSRTVVAEKARTDGLMAKLIAPVECTSREAKARLQGLLREYHGSDTDTQEKRVLEALKGGSVTTHERMRPAKSS